MENIPAGSVFSSWTQNLPNFSGVTGSLTGISQKVLPFVSQYKYWILSILIAVILIYFATKAESYSQEAVQAEIAQLESLVKKKKIPIDHVKLGDLYYKQYVLGLTSERKQNYNKAVGHLEKCFNNNVDVCMKLAKLYHNGLAESYDKDGAKVTGIPPNAEKSVFFYTKAAQMGNGDALLQMADIYHWGLLGFDTNKEYAKQLYLILRKIGNEYQKGVAKDRLLQLKEEDGSVIGSGLSPAEPSIDLGGFGGGFETFGQNLLDEDHDPEMDNDNKDVNMLSERLGIVRTNDSEGGGGNPVGEKFVNNPHNVTDHVIDNTVKQVIAKLKPSTPIVYQVQQTFRDIKRWILAQRCGEDKKQDALLALQEIGKSLDQRSYEETLEIEALQLVWNRIHSNINSANKNILKQNLFNELAECIEYGQVVCRKGRITRLIDVLNDVDPEVSIKPKWALNEEMLRQAGVLRTDAIGRAAPATRDALTSPNPSPDQILLCQKFHERFKRDLVKDLFAKYVDTGLMSKELLKTEVGKWIDAI